MNRGRLWAASSAAVLLVGAAAIGWTDQEAPAPAAGQVSVEPRLVLVSGRDDHGMVAADQVPLHDAPESDREVATVQDGTLAEVLATEGQWLQVRTVEGVSAIGWVHDFFLRGEARLVGAAPSCEVRVAGDRRPGGTVVVVRELRGERILVETVTPPQARGWAARADLQELPPQGSRCGDIPPGGRHAH